MSHAAAAQRLARLLFGIPAPRLRCLVAELPSGEVIGHATCAPQLSTWQGRESLRLDCLFLSTSFAITGTRFPSAEASSILARRNAPKLFDLDTVTGPSLLPRRWSP